MTATGGATTGGAAAPVVAADRSGLAAALYLALPNGNTVAPFLHNNLLRDGWPLALTAGMLLLCPPQGRSAAR